MKKWEYKIIDSTDVTGSGIYGDKRVRGDIEHYFNTLGDEGWEIIVMDVNESEARINFIGFARREKGAES